MTKAILKTILKNNSQRTPIWFMRQAGRYLPEFMEIKKSYNSFFDICMDSDAVAEVTMQPIRRFDLDAAIIFSDILIIPYANGASVKFEVGGPVIDIADMYKNPRFIIYDRLKEAIIKVRQELSDNHKDVALIGFSGAPWTVACYMLEGKLTKDFNVIKKLVYTNSTHLKDIIDSLVRDIVVHLSNQIEAGAEIIKIFDSWASVLEPEQFYKWILEPTKKVVETLRKKFPNIKIICFPKGIGLMYIDYCKEIKPDVIALDSGVPLPWAKNNIKDVVFQGNIDNILLASSLEASKKKIKEIFEILKTGTFIFNSGHGIIPTTPVGHLDGVIKYIREIDDGISN